MTSIGPVPVADGVTTVMEVALTDVTEAALPPKVTEGAGRKFAPLKTTTVPPLVEPEAGLSPVGEGAGC